MAEVPVLVDWYAVLGVQPDADEAGLRLAWRGVARALHPDTDPGDAAADRFQLAREAWATLSDPARRAAHDAARRRFADAVAPLPSGFIERLVGVRSPEPEHGRDLRCELRLPAEAAVTGAVRTLALPGHRDCGLCGGTGLAPRGRPIVCGRCGGRCFEVSRPVLRATSAPCGACDAAGWVPEHACAGCGGRGAVAAERAIEVVIPAGLRAGATVTVAGAGLPARGRGQAGDLRVVLDLAPGRWEVAGTDWTGPVEVPFWLALAGGTWEADTPWGPRVVALPPGTREGAVLRLGGLGVGRQGDGFLIVRLRWPERLTPDERSALRQWGEGVIAREAAAGDSASVDTGGAG